MALDDLDWQTYRIDTLLIPAGTLCYVHQLSGTVWMAQGVPAVRWLKDMEDDAWAATVGATDARRNTSTASPMTHQRCGARGSTSVNDVPRTTGDR